MLDQQENRFRILQDVYRLGFHLKVTGDANYRETLNPPITSLFSTT